MSRALQRALLVLSMAGAWVGLICTSVGETAVPPAWLGLVALATVVVFAVEVAHRTGQRGWIGALVLGFLFLALGGVVIQDFLRPGVARGHDIQHHAWGFWSLWRCVLEGDLWPRWNPYLGLGVPLLSFYGPLIYVLGWPAQALGASPLQAMAFVLLLFQIIGAVGAYQSVRWLGGSRPGGIIAAFGLALAPYHLLDQNFRVALGETLALALFIPVFAATWKTMRGEGRKAAWVLGGGMATLLLVHTLSAVMAILGIVLIFSVGLLGGDRSATAPRHSLARWGRGLRSLLLTGLVTAGVTAAWWVPVALEQDHTSVGVLSKPGRVISTYAATSDEVLRRQLWTRYDIRRPLSRLWAMEAAEARSPSASTRAAIAVEKERRRGMPMYFGWGLMLLLLLGLLLPAGDSSRGVPAGRQPWDPVSRRPLALVGVLLLALAIWPLAALLDGLPLFGRIMFPWRLLAPATALAALVGGLSWDSIEKSFCDDEGGLRGLKSRLLVLLLLALLAVDGAPFLGAAARYPAVPGSGLFVFDGERAVEADLPRDRFLRIEDAPLPPADYDWDLAKSRWVFSEYMAAPLRQRYGKLTRPPSLEESAYFGAEVRFSGYSARRMDITPAPLVEVRASGGEWQRVPRDQWELKPQSLVVQLETNELSSELRFKGAWFPGWRVRADGGEWWDTQPGEEHLLGASVPPNTREVEFRYFFSHPRHRPLSLLLSLLMLCGTVGSAWRLHRRV